MCALGHRSAAKLDSHTHVGYGYIQKEIEDPSLRPPYSTSEKMGLNFDLRSQLHLRPPETITAKSDMPLPNSCLSETNSLQLYTSCWVRNKTETEELVKDYAWVGLWVFLFISNNFSPSFAHCKHFLFMYCQKIIQPSLTSYINQIFPKRNSNFLS